MPLLSRLAVQAARAYGILSAADKTKVTASYLVVAGGGGGGFDIAGGGGAGGYQTSTATLSTLNTYSITVGAGGAGATSNSAQGTNGGVSSLSGTGLTTVTSTGGGGGGTNNTSLYAGVSGGSGGGSTNGASAGTGTSGQGNAGGVGTTALNAFSGGGGGAGAVGGAGSSSGGNGGNGLASSISGSSVTYAGGGGGGAYTGTRGTGGTGGGGNGGPDLTVGSDGSVNLGGGGGGGGRSRAGGAGGSGVVIISYASATPRFVGGTLTTSGGNQIHTFTSSGTLSPLTPVTASYLVVAGGGSGATSVGFTEASGGGGAGGLLSGSTTLYSGATYIVTVGAGGAGPSAYNVKNDGSNSSLSGTGLTTLTSIGGGAGAPDGNGNSGGSGGGAGAANNSRTGGAGTSGQGNSGGNNFPSGTTSLRSGGGGGGSGAAGANATSGQGGAGGAGTSSSISGTSVFYAAGGGGSSQTAAGSGGSSIGGNGQGVSPSQSATSGVINTGSGGGAANSTNGGSGGSGIVIISYAGSQQFNGGLVTSSGGNTIHTFTATGALTPLTNNLNNSLRFRSSASAYLSRTPASAGNRKTWTWSSWIKRGELATRHDFFSAGTASNNTDTMAIRFDTSANLTLAMWSADIFQTTQLFRDPSAWYHIVLAMDTTQATAANRVKLYINGNQVTNFTSITYPSQNADLGINGNVAHNIGRLAFSGGAFYFDGYMTDINFIDGQALEPYYFGNNDANGVWKPIKYTGTYGTNGFYLTFGNTTSTTTLGYDSSPNGNNWTTNNISLTAGVTYDAMLDVPTNTSATTANFSTLNPVQTATANITWANANLQASLGTTAAWRTAISTMAVDSGKWYAEFTLTTSGGAASSALGILPITDSYSGSYLPGSTAGSYGYPNDGTKYNNGNNTAYGSTYTTGDIIGIAYDGTNNKIWFSKNGTWQASGDPAAGTNAAFTTNSGTSYYFGVAGAGATQSVWNCNFGQRPFAYTPPTGYVALNTYNLPTPTILQGNKYMDATLWAGNSSTQTIVNQAQFKADMVWIKNRTNSVGGFHNVFDSVRGVHKRLFTNDTQAEDTNSDTLQSFNSNGYTLGTNANVNATSSNYVGWQWQAGAGTTSTNTSGSISSTVSANTTAGFSVVTYTGTGVAATIGHGLGVAPKFYIVKRRNGGTDYWCCYHTSIGATKGIYLNTTDAAGTSDLWNNTEPTSSVFSVKTTGGVNASGGTYVAYCWAEIAGFSKFGSYTGNGSTNGPFIYTGFRPRYLLIKCTSTAEQWAIKDTALVPYNTNNTQFFANASDAETTDNTYHMTDFLSNGFKIRGAAQNLVNGNGQTYIYMAFAEHPFKNSNSR